MSTILSSRKVAVVLALGILLFASTVLFYRLNAAPFQDYDEATYAEIVDESLAHGNFVSLTFLNQPYFRKPPLMFWIADAARSVLPDSQTEFAMRLPSVLAALASIVLVMLIVGEAGAGWWAVLVAGFVLTTTSAFMESARSARFDQLVSFFILAAFYAGMRALRAKREERSANDATRSVWWYALMGAAVGGAVLSKSVIAVFAPTILFAYLVYTRNLSELFRARFWVSIVAFLAVAAPWHVYETLMYGHDFWHSYLGTQVIDRAQENLFAGTNSPTNSGYFWYLLRFAAPWSELLLLILLISPAFLLRMRPNVSATYRSVFVAALSVMTIDFVSKTKAVSYLIPLYPFMAIMIALGASALWERASSLLRGCEQMQGALLGMWKFCGLVALFLVVYNAWHINTYYQWTTYEARDEKAIAQAINAHTDTPTIYTYKNDDLGSVEYYTRLPFKPSLFVYPLESATSLSSLSQDSFVLTQDPAALRAAFPHFSFDPLYIGSVLSAFTVTAAS